MMLLFRIVVLLFALSFHTSAVFAQSSPLNDEEKQAIWDAATLASIHGPTNVDLGDQATLALQGDHVFIPKKEASQIMRMWGNSTNAGFNGLIFSADNNQTWTIAIDHIDEGYVKDDDAKTWNAEELLQSLKDGTEAQNQERVAMGIPAMDVVGWIQKPQYDEIDHQLKWSLKAVDRGAPIDQPATVNYNTYALGRDGYFKINLLTSDKDVEKEKIIALAVVKSVKYNSGKRYEDFDPNTDKIAEYGLAALVAGVAAKKLGLFAVISLFVVKFAKIIAVGAAVLGASVFKLFRRNAE